MARISELLGQGKYYEALVELASDKLAVRLLRGHGVLDNLARTLAELAVALEGVPPDKVEEVLRKLGVPFDPRRLQELYRYDGAALIPAVRGIVECLDKLCPPDKVLALYQAVPRDWRPLARRLVLLYIYKYIEKVGLSDDLAKLAKAAGYQDVASVIESALKVVKTVPEALRQVFAREVAEIAKLAEDIRDASARVEAGDIDALKRLLSDIKLLEWYSKLTGVKFKGLGDIAVAAVAAALLARPDAYSQIASIASQYGVPMPPRPTPSDIICAIEALGYTPGAGFPKLPGRGGVARRAHVYIM